MLSSLIEHYFISMSFWCLSFSMMNVLNSLKVTNCWLLLRAWFFVRAGSCNWIWVLVLSWLVLHTFWWSHLYHEHISCILPLSDYGLIVLRWHSFLILSEFEGFYVEFEISNFHGLMVLSVHLMKIHHFTSRLLLFHIGVFHITQFLLVCFDFSPELIFLYSWKCPVSRHFRVDGLGEHAYVRVGYYWLRSELCFFSLWLEVGVFDEHSKFIINETIRLLKSVEIKESQLQLLHCFRHQFFSYQLWQTELNFCLLHLKVDHDCLLGCHLGKKINTIF